MYHQDRASIAVKEWMTIGKTTHDYARLRPHEFLVLTMGQRKVDRSLNMLGMSEEQALY